MISPPSLPNPQNTTDPEFLPSLPLVRNCKLLAFTIHDEVGQVVVFPLRQRLGEDVSSHLLRRAGLELQYAISLSLSLRVASRTSRNFVRAPYSRSRMTVIADELSSMTSAGASSVPSVI